MAERSVLTLFTSLGIVSQLEIRRSTNPYRPASLPVSFRWKDYRANDRSKSRVMTLAVSQKALLIVRPTRCVAALQPELPTNVPRLVELPFGLENALAKFEV